MSPINSLQRSSLKRLQREFEEAARSHGPLRCGMIHREGDYFKAKLRPPSDECMRDHAQRSVLYSYRVYHENGKGGEVLHDPPTIGTNVNPFLEFREEVARQEVAAGRDIYLVHGRKEDNRPILSRDAWSRRDDPEHKRLVLKTREACEAFWKLAGDAGECFSRGNLGSLPGVARESLEASDDRDRWVWIVFDMAWQNVEGPPLKAERRIWHEAKNGDLHTFHLGMDFVKERDQVRQRCKAQGKSPRSSPLGFPKDWAKRKPTFYYSGLGDLFRASVYAIDILLAIKDRDRPKDLVTTEVALTDYQTSRRTIWRKIKDGELTDYRPPDSPTNATYRLSRKQLDRLFARKK